MKLFGQIQRIFSQKCDFSGNPSSKKEVAMTSKDRYLQIQKLLTEHLKSEKIVQNVNELPESFVSVKEAILLAERSSKLLLRLFLMFDLRVVKYKESYYYDKSDCEYLRTQKKPKNLKAIGLGNLHKATVSRLQRKGYEIVLEKRFASFKLPFDIYIPAYNCAIC